MEKLQTQMVLLVSKRNPKNTAVLTSSAARWKQEAKEFSRIWDSPIRVYMCEYRVTVRNQLKIEQDKAIRKAFKSRAHGDSADFFCKDCPGGWRK